MKNNKIYKSEQFKFDFMNDVDKQCFDYLNKLRIEQLEIESNKALVNELYARMKRFDIIPKIV